MPVPLFTTHCSPWQLETKNVQAVLGPCTVLASPKELQRWPAVQGGYGVNFKLNCTDGWALPLSLYDQGRYVTGKRDSLGVGIKITATRTPHKVQREKPRVVVPSGTGVLYFVIVARLTLLKQTKLSVQALQPIEDMLRKLGLGGEHGYGVLQDRCTVLLFDIARSPAWFVNSDAHSKCCENSNTLLSCDVSPKPD